MAKNRIQVTFFQRKRRPNANYSLESIFEDVRSRLNQRIETRFVLAPFYSNGVIRRIAITLSAWWNQGQITHVTGDINFAAILMPSRSTILTILDCGFLERTSGIRKWLLRIFWLSLPVSRASVVTTISDSARNDIIRHTGCNPEKVRVIPVAISEQFRPFSKEDFGDHPRILQIGTAPNKNIPRVLEALVNIPCTLVVVGTLHPEIQQAINVTGVEVENYVNLTAEEILRQYQLADVVIFASTFEGFGMPIVEAQSVGRPVITSNISSMPEVAGDAACLVDPFDIASIRAGVLKVLQDKEYRQQLIHKGFVNAERFDPQAIAQQYYELYQSLAFNARASNS